MTAFQRVRLSADKSELFVMATSGATSALAAVPIETGSDSRAERFAAWDGPFEIDLSPSTVRRIRQVFPCREANADGEYDVVQLDMTPDAIMISDASGLFVEILGQALRVSCLPYSSDYPNLRDALARALAPLGNRRPPSPWCPPAGCSPCSTTRPPPTACPSRTRGPDPRNRAGSSCVRTVVHRARVVPAQRRQLARQAGRLPPQAHGAPRAAAGVGARVMARHPGGRACAGMLAAPLALIVLAVLMAVL